MNKRIPLTLAAAVLAATGTVTAQAAGLSGNISMTNNYIFRGVTQTSDEAAVQGGLDWENDSGVYLGTWISNLSGGGYEWDLYGGYKFDAGPVGLDVGFISYEYPVTNDYYRELYVNGSWKMLSFGAAFTVDSKTDNDGFDDGDLYLYVGADFEGKNGLGYGVLVGNYDFDSNLSIAGGNIIEDYTHVRGYLSKGDFTFAVDKNDLPGTGNDELRLTVNWSQSFDL